jgi:hypothetical protein
VSVQYCQNPPPPLPLRRRCCPSTAPRRATWALAVFASTVPLGQVADVLQQHQLRASELQLRLEGAEAKVAAMKPLKTEVETLRRRLREEALAAKVACDPTTVPSCVLTSPCSTVGHWVCLCPSLALIVCVCARGLHCGGVGVCS